MRRASGTAALIFAAGLGLSGCSGGKIDGRGVQQDETLLSVSATGQAETTPDMATFMVGVESIKGSAKAASTANADTMAKLVAALKTQGIPEKDIQTRNLSVNRIDYGKNRGQYAASNQVSIRVRDVKRVSAAVGAATEVGANVLNGPSLTLSDPEKARLSAYGAAYKAAKARADAYAEAAEMTVSRVLSIRDGSSQSGPPQPYYYGDAVATEQAAPRPVSASPPFQAGSNIDQVSVTVEFALDSK